MTTAAAATVATSAAATAAVATSAAAAVANAVALLSRDVCTHTYYYCCYY
jgi:hypothetical protein